MMLQLGPFQGITDVWFRKAFVQFFGNIDKYYTPFFGGVCSRSSKFFGTDELNPAHSIGQLVVPQLLTNDPAELEIFALGCHAIGYDEINLNLGCPWPQVTTKKRGCGLMPYPELVEKLLSPVRYLPLKVSVKCRLGMQSPTELMALLPIFEQAGISELIVHARTADQRYAGEARMHVLSTMMHQLHLPLVYNGDIFEADQLHAIETFYPGLRGVMLGRGLLADPFLAADIKRSSSSDNQAERSVQVKQFLENLFALRVRAHRHEKAILGPMKELWEYLSLSFDKPKDIWNMIKKTKTIDEFIHTQDFVFEHHAWTGRGYARKQFA